MAELGELLWGTEQPRCFNCQCSGPFVQERQGSTEWKGTCPPRSPSMSLLQMQGDPERDFQRAKQSEREKRQSHGVVFPEWSWGWPGGAGEPPQRTTFSPSLVPQFLSGSHSDAQGLETDFFTLHPPSQSSCFCSYLGTPSSAWVGPRHVSK